MKSLCFLMIAFVLTGCQRNGHYENEEIVLGYRGKARLNPYLAAERYFAEKLSVPVRSSRSLADLDESISVVTMPASFLSTRLMGQRVLDWVGNGGSLILLMEGGESHYNDFSDRALGPPKNEKNEKELELPGLDLILAKTDMTLETREFVMKKGGKDDPGERDWHEENVSMDERDFLLEQEGELAFAEDGDEPWPVVSASPGEGIIYFLANARPLRSAYLDRADHLAFLETMIGDPSGEVLFLYGEGFSFWSLVWRHGWRLVLAGLVMLMVWLWLRLPRFGPRQEEERADDRQYDELLLAGGRFLWKRKAVAPLLLPLREEIQRRFHLRHELVSEAERASLFEELSARSGMKLEEVIEAMSREDLQDGATLTRVVRGLKQLQNTR